MCDLSLAGNSSKSSTKTSKHLDNTSCKSRSSAKGERSKQTFDDSNDNDEYSENESDTILKPRALFEDGDVPGERMFSFNSKQRKSSQKTSNSKKNLTETEVQSYKDNDSQSLTDRLSSYKSPKKSKKNHAINNSKTNVECVLDNSKMPRLEKYNTNEQILTKTPRVVRKQIAKGIANQKFEQLHELNDSDYSISDKSNDSSDSDSSVGSNSQPEINDTNISLRRSARKKNVHHFCFKSEDYFLSKSAKSLKKSKTSDNTLKLLKNPVLDKIQVDTLSENANIIHDKKLKALYEEIVSKFSYWSSLLKAGFNVLLYGLGSKRQTINDFRTSMLEKESVLVINGFYPGLTLKEILESITIDLLDLENCPGSTEQAIQEIEEKLKSKSAHHIYILIHNIDGVALQSSKVQHALSRICSLKNVHLIASVDKVNSALMWDNTKLSDYNFIWMDCTNYLPYTVETSYIESLMVKNTGSIQAFSALNNVYKSLNSNSKHILLLLIKNRIDNKHDKKYGGVPFSTLYDWCREQFLVSTDLALRSQLTEFVDHQLVKWKRDSDVLYIPVDVDVLIQFYKQNEEGCE